TASSVCDTLHIGGITRPVSAISAGSASNVVLETVLTQSRHTISLCTELTKMMVDMEVGPTEPRGFRHPAEYRMRLPVERPRRCGYLIQQRFELREVACEVDRLRASQLLIDFRSRKDSCRPR